MERTYKILHIDIEDEKIWAVKELLNSNKMFSLDQYDIENFQDNRENIKLHSYDLIIIHRIPTKEIKWLRTNTSAPIAYFSATAETMKLSELGENIRPLWMTETDIKQNFAEDLENLIKTHSI